MIGTKLTFGALSKARGELGKRSHSGVHIIKETDSICILFPERHETRWRRVQAASLPRQAAMYGCIGLHQQCLLPPQSQGEQPPHPSPEQRPVALHPQVVQRLLPAPDLVAPVGAVPGVGQSGFKRRESNRVISPGTFPSPFYREPGHLRNESTTRKVVHPFWHEGVVMPPMLD